MPPHERLTRARLMGTNWYMYQSYSVSNSLAPMAWAPGQRSLCPTICLASPPLTSHCLCLSPPLPPGLRYQTRCWIPLSRSRCCSYCLTHSQMQALGRHRISQGSFPHSQPCGSGVGISGPDF